MAELPIWATLKRARTDYRIAVYEIDPDKAYPMIFTAMKAGLKEVLPRDGLNVKERIAMINAINGLRPESDGDVSPKMLPELSAEALMKIDEMPMDQFWYETCYQTIKLEMQRCLGIHDFEIHIKGSGDYKTRWRQKDLAPGRGIEAATGRYEGKTLHRHITGGVEPPKPTSEAKGLFSKMLRKTKD